MPAPGERVTTAKEKLVFRLTVRLAVFIAIGVSVLAAIIKL